MVLIKSLKNYYPYSADAQYVAEVNPYISISWVHLEPNWNEVTPFERYRRTVYWKLPDGREFTPLILDQSRICLN